MDPNNQSEQTLVLILGEIKGQLGTYIKFMETLQEKHDSLESRVRGVENFKFWIMGAAATVGGIAGFIVDLVKP